MVLGTGKPKERRMGAFSKKNKKSWFEMLCTMDATDTREGDRTRVSSHAAGPYGRDEDIPPFDNDTPEPIGDHIFEEVEGKKKTATS